MTDKDTLKLIQDLHQPVYILGTAVKDMFEFHSTTTLLLIAIYGQLNPEQLEKIESLQADMQETRERMQQQFHN